MKTIFILILLGLLIYSQYSYAQTNADKAKLCYYKAEEQFQAGNYQNCIDKLNEAIQLLGKSNARIQYLIVKSYKGLENYKQVKIELSKYFSFKPDEDEWYKEMLMLSGEIDALIKQKDDAEALKKNQQEEFELQVKKQKEADEAAENKKNETAELNRIINEINLDLANGKNKEAQVLLDIAVIRDPNNPVLHFASGANLESLGNLELAEKSYLKAIELKPDYFDAIYNLGAFYFNKGVAIYQEADIASDVNKYAELQIQYKKMWTEKAQPWLEKALELNNKDQKIIIALKQIYLKTGQMDKYKLIIEK